MFPTIGLDDLMDLSIVKPTDLRMATPGLCNVVPDVSSSDLRTWVRNYTEWDLVRLREEGLHPKHESTSDAKRRDVCLRNPNGHDLLRISVGATYLYPHAERHRGLPSPP